MSKRLRIFGGPNGSGKTTLYRVTKDKFHLGIMINADEIEAELRNKGCFSFREKVELHVHKEKFFISFQSSSLFVVAGGAGLLAEIDVLDDILFVKNTSLLNSYFAAYVAEYIRVALLDTGKSMAFETVMSDIRKLDFIRLAKEKGYRIYLYFITTINPMLNVERVEKRVAQGGHSVPKDKIISRYTRSLDNLYDAIMLSDRSFLFDNSSEQPQWIAETEGKSLKIQGEQIPQWFQKFVLDKITIVKK